MLGNHRGIQENEARKKNASGQVHSRASHQGCHFIYAIYISHKWAMTIIRVVTQYEPRVQCEILALRLDQLLPWLQLILPFLLPLAFFLSLTHTRSFKWIPTLILILLFHLFLSSPCSMFLFVFPCTATPPPTSAHSGQHATVRAPTITSADTLMLKLSCLSLTINDQQPVYLCQGQEEKNDI